MLQILASDVEISGTIDADGGVGGIKSAGSCTSGGGGGGAGGGVWVQADRLKITGQITALGERGGSGGLTTNGGGSGSDGRILIGAPKMDLSARRILPRAYEASTAPACPQPDDE
jgi:hypothetical protein